MDANPEEYGNMLPEQYLTYNEESFSLWAWCLVYHLDTLDMFNGQGIVWGH